MRHPAITSGLVGGALAGSTCELATADASTGTTGDLKACSIVTGAVGLGLGLVVAAAILLGGEGHTVLWDGSAASPPPPLHVFKHADAGVELDAAVDAVPADAATD